MLMKTSRFSNFPYKVPCSKLTGNKRIYHFIFIYSMIENIKYIFRNRKAKKERTGREVIEPATGEKQRILENTSHVMIQPEYGFDNEGILDFTSNMIGLLGGTSEPGRNKGIKKSSNPLNDSQNKQSISFHINTSPGRYGQEEEAEIIAQGGTISERIKYWRKPTTSSRVPIRGALSWGPDLVQEVHLPKSPVIDSYISGKDEEIFPSGTVTRKRPFDTTTEAKPFFKRVLDVYQQTKKHTS
jgi:hypothetical protein